MKRLVFGVGICLVVLAMSSLTAVAGEKVDEVRIGIVVPLSGIGATVGTQMKTGATIAIDEINAKGGIKALGGAKLRLIAGDSQGKPDVGASETERLIQRENVHVMIGSYQSATTIVTTEVAERYKTPWVVLASVSDRITGRGFKYVFPALQHGRVRRQRAAPGHQDPDPGVRQGAQDVRLAGRGD